MLGFERKVSEALQSISQISTGRDLRVHDGPDGRSIVAAPRYIPFSGQFFVSVQNSKEAQISPGTCDGQIPAIDQILLNGMKDGKQGDVPTLDLSEGPGPALTSYVCLQVKTDPKTGLVKDPTDPQAYTIIHRSTPVPRANGLIKDDGNGKGQLELALLLWSDSNTISGLVQNVYFAQSHSFQQGVHYFRPSA